MLAQDPELGAERLFPRETGRAAVAGEAGVDHHPVARAHRGHARADLLHHTGAVGPHHVGKGGGEVGKAAVTTDRAG
jgi:hypothetical protein